MSQNGQINFKNLAAFAERFLSVSDQFEALFIKGLNNFLNDLYQTSCRYHQSSQTMKKLNLFQIVFRVA